MPRNTRAGLITALIWAAVVPLSLSSVAPRAMSQEKEIVQDRRGPAKIRDKVVGETPLHERVLEKFDEDSFRGVTPEVRTGPWMVPTPDLELAPCEVLCDRGGGYSAEVCDRYGYSDQFTYMVRARLRNVGQLPAVFEPGWRIWESTPLEGVRAELLQVDPSRQDAPPGGITLEPGAEMPEPYSPAILNLLLPPGDHSLVFVANPQGRMDENMDRNNRSECKWEVVASAPAGSFDLAITGVAVSPEAGTPYSNFNITVTLKNTGSALVDTIRTVCHPGGSLLFTGMDEGQETVLTFLVPGIPEPGVKKVVCTARFVRYPDRDTSNNTKTQLFTVTQP